MKHLILVLVLAAFTACTARGTDPTVKCPDSKDQSLTREQWEACYGHQDKDSSGSR